MSVHFRMTDFGFEWGPLRVTRITSDDGLG